MKRHLVPWRCERCERIVMQPPKVHRVLHRCEMAGRPTKTTELQRIEGP